MKSKSKKPERSAAGKLFVVSAPSGAGKTTLVEHAVRELGASHKLSRVITYTTKKPRPQDIAGVDYHFITRQEFEAKIAQDFFLEYSDAYGEYYGTSRELIAQVEAGESLVVIVDKQGARAIKLVYADAVLIWVSPPSIEVLKERLESRGTESAENIMVRFNLAQQELEDIEGFDYIILNAVLTEALENFKLLFKQELKDR